jgi:hypothetical protein
MPRPVALLSTLACLVARGREARRHVGRQARIVLQRQLRQVPRWLGEDHDHGPPQTLVGKLRFAFRRSTTVANPPAPLGSVANPPAPLGSFHTGAGARTPAERLRSLTPPA